MFSGFKIWALLAGGINEAHHMKATKNILGIFGAEMQAQEHATSIQSALEAEEKGAQAHGGTEDKSQPLLVARPKRRATPHGDSSKVRREEERGKIIGRGARGG